MITRCLSPEIVNAVVNHADVRPFVGPGGVLDMTQAVEADENWFLMGEHGGFALIWSAPHVYEVHTFIKAGGRGQWAKDAAAQGIDYARCNGARLLWTKIAPAMANVAAFAESMGMRPAGITVQTFGEPYAVYKMEIG